MNWEGDRDLRVIVANLMIVLDNGMTSLMTASQRFGEMEEFASIDA